MLAPNAYPALLLNADFRPLSFFPLSTRPWEHAIKGIVEDTLAVVSEYPEPEAVVRSPSVAMRLPSVVALRSYVPPSRHIAFTRFNVFLRDGFRCQYCDKRHAPADLTFDHVVPRSAGGPTAWTNIVAACWPCNMRKAAGSEMRPRRAPERPSARVLLTAQREFPPRYLHDDWLSYLYWDSEIEP